MKSETRKPVIAAALVSAALTLLLYGPALALPLYSDDLLQVPWVEATPLTDLWRAVGPYRDYRPLHFTLWRLLYLLAGDLRPALLHSLNLAGHALCGTLVGLLAARWKRRPWLAALVGAAFFVVFPFAFDAVPWAIAFSYPLATALTLGALLCYLRACKAGRFPLHALAAVLTMAAGFAHEGGVAAGPTILLAAWTLRRRGRRDTRLWPFAHLIASAVPLAASALVRPQGTAFYGLVWPDLTSSAAYALQALTFPAAPLAGLLARVGMGAVLAVAVVGLAALAGLTWLAGRGREPDLSSLGLGWWALWSLPPLLTLRSDWLMDAPRVFYPAGVGVALLWTEAMDGVLSLVRWKRAWVLLAVLVALSLVPAGWFVVGSVALQRQAGDLLWDVVAAAEEGGPLLVVNLPSRIDPPERLYPLGREGIIPLPPRVGAGDLVAAHTGRAGAAFERALGRVLPRLPYTVRPLGEPLSPDDLRAAGRVALVVYRSNGMSLEEAGAILPTRDVETSAARFGDRMLLVSAFCTRVAPDRVLLSTYWQVLEPVDGTPTLFAHLLAVDGSLLAQADGDPVRGLYPFFHWQPGEVVRDLRAFDDAPAGAATVALGVWDPAAGVRWEATRSDGESLPDDAYPCAVREP